MCEWWHYLFGFDGSLERPIVPTHSDFRNKQDMEITVAALIKTEKHP